MADETNDGQKAPSCKGNINASEDLIRQGYKYYKRKKPPPDFSEVIDFNNPETFRGRVSEFSLQTLPHARHGLRCAREWKAYQLLSCPGFIFIVNPFLPGAQNYWTRRCIEDLTRKPNVSNLDAHMTIKENESVWELSRNGQDQDLMSRLRWVHLGYQFDYNVVDYKPEHYFGFPEDLSGLMQHIAEAIGYPGYTPEAGIINYYPIGTSMGGHTDHYELDLSWPLISISFGQPAVFLIGGKTKDIKPTAMYIHSGDVAIMSGESRLAFHAVPRILKVGDENEPPDCLKWIDSQTSEITQTNCECNGMLLEKDKETKKIPQKESHLVQCGFNSLSKMRIKENSDNGSVKKGEHKDDKIQEKPDFSCKCNKNERFMNSVTNLSKDDWLPFEQYLSKTRINVNVRQVHSL